MYLDPSRASSSVRLTSSSVHPIVIRDSLYTSYVIHLSRIDNFPQSFRLLFLKKSLKFPRLCWTSKVRSFLPLVLSFINFNADVLKNANLCFTLCCIWSLMTGILIDLKNYTFSLIINVNTCHVFMTFWVYWTLFVNSMCSNAVRLLVIE